MKPEVMAHKPTTRAPGQGLITSEAELHRAEGMFGDPAFDHERNPVPFIDNLLGQTTIEEEQKGNFSDARAQIQLKLASAHGQGTANDAKLGSIHFALGFVCFLQGNAGQAIADFETALKYCVDDIDLQLRVLIYCRQAHWLRYRFFPNRAVSPIIEDLDVKTDYLDHDGKILRQIKQLTPSLTDPRLQAEQTVLRTQRSCWIARQAGNDTIASGFAGDCEIWTRSDSTRTDSKLLAPCNLLVGGALFPKDKDGAIQALDRAHATYRGLGDEVGLATCHMKRGDWLVTFAGPPETLNTLVMEGSDGYLLLSDNERWNFHGDADSIDTARGCYEDAQKGYKKCNCLRGQAAVSLRLAYLEVLRPVKTMGEMHTCHKAAEELLIIAADMYRTAEDWMGYYTATAHLALARIGSAGLTRADLETAAELGRWGLGTGSYSFALGLGVLYCRIGQKWLRGEADYERSLACLQIAAGVFKALEASISSLQVILDQLDIFQLLGYGSAFDVLARKGLHQCDSAAMDNPRLDSPTFRKKRAILQKMFTVSTQRGNADEIHQVAKLIRSMDQLPEVPPQLPMSHEGYFSWAEAKMCVISKAATDTLATQSTFLEALFRGQQAAKEDNFERARVFYAKAREAARPNKGLMETFMKSMILAYENVGGEENRQSVELFEAYIAMKNDSSNLCGIPSTLQEQSLQQTEKQALQFFCKIKDFAKAKLHLQSLNEKWPHQWWITENQPWEYLGLIGETLQGNGCFEEALTMFESSMDNFERYRNRLTDDQLKIALSSQSAAQSIYLEAAHAAMETCETGPKLGDETSISLGLCKAFAFIERGKARSLLDLVSSGPIHQMQQFGQEDDLLKWRQLRAWLSTRQSLLSQELQLTSPNQSRLSNLRKQIELAEAEMHEVEHKISANNKDRSISAEVISLHDLKSCLPEGTAVLQYIFAENGVLTWAVTNERVLPIHIPKPSRNHFISRIRDFHRRCDQGIEHEKQGKWLSDELLGPFEHILKTNNRLIIVPHGPAHVLPYHALPWYHDPLIQTHVVTYSPSASLIPLMLAYPAATAAFFPKVLAVGNPSEMAYTQGLPGELSSPERPLPAAEEEVEYIAKLIPGSKSLTCNDATLSAVMADAPNFSVLHFATHCHLSADVPLLSAVLLAKGTMLTVHRLAGMHMDIPLVVLSGCQSGLGHTTAGDDVIGLSRALLAAGVRRAVVSLWLVPDGPTAILMGEFYRRLKAGDPPAQALQVAQNFLRGLRKGKLNDALRAVDEAVRAAGRPIKTGRRGVAPPEDYTHPRYWASFFLVGV